MRSPVRRERLIKLSVAVLTCKSMRCLFAGLCNWRTRIPFCDGDASAIETLALTIAMVYVRPPHIPVVTRRLDVRVIGVEVSTVIAMLLSAMTLSDMRNEGGTHSVLICSLSSSPFPNAGSLPTVISSALSMVSLRLTSPRISKPEQTSFAHPPPLSPPQSLSAQAAPLVWLDTARAQ